MQFQITAETLFRLGDHNDADLLAEAVVIQIRRVGKGAGCTEGAPAFRGSVVAHHIVGHRIGRAPHRDGSAAVPRSVGHLFQLRQLAHGQRRGDGASGVLREAVL